MNTIGKVVAVLLLFLMAVPNVFAKTWLVGPMRVYTLPSQVSVLVNDGDTIAIDSGVYSKDVAYWAANNLVIEGVGGLARLKSGGLNYGGKAIWVINGNNTIIKNIEFADCTCTDNNGAGIRQQGTDLIVSYCLFDNNQEGILAGDDTLSDILIEHTEFYNNCAGDGYSHNLYINHVHSLTFQYNYTHHANVGHELKSRAYNNYILYNRFADEATGTASRDIDLPNGGLAIIIGNEIEKGPDAQNENVMEYGLEGLTNKSTQLYLVNNTFVMDRTGSSVSFIDLQNGTTLCRAYNNIFAGSGKIIIGSATTIDTSNNWYVSIANAGFVNANGYDYHLLSTSDAINNGTDPDSAGSYSLTPIYEYVQPVSDTNRIVNGALDIGSHEYGIATGIDNSYKGIKLMVYPNPTKGSLNIELTEVIGAITFKLFDRVGRLVFQKEMNAKSNKLNLSERKLSAGLYLLEAVNNSNTYIQTIIIAP